MPRPCARVTARAYGDNGTLTLGYDAESRLTAASATGLTASYAYDGQGRRKSKTVNGTTTVFVTDAANREVLEYDGGSGAILRWYAYGPGPNDVVNRTDVASGTRTAYIPDIQGSIVATLASTGTTLTPANYLPYGANANAPNTFAYTGQRIDPESGLYYYRARHYSPLLGRFLQPDPLGYQGGINLYAYVGNDPLNATDPNGQVADAITNSDFYNQTVLQAGKDIGDLLSNPGEIPGAIASVLPGLGPIAELPQAVSGALGVIRAIGSLENMTSGQAPSSQYDSSITSEGSQYTNIQTNVTAEDFQSNLIANGYSIVKETNNEYGPVTVLSNGSSTYTIYGRTSTAGSPGAQFFGPDGNQLKFSLGNP